MVASVGFGRGGKSGLHWAAERATPASREGRIRATETSPSARAEGVKRGNLSAEQDQIDSAWAGPVHLT